MLSKKERDEKDNIKIVTLLAPSFLSPFLEEDLVLFPPTSLTPHLENASHLKFKKYSILALS